MAHRAETTITDLRELVAPLHPDHHGKLGAHVGGGDPRIPLLRDYLSRPGQQVSSVPRGCHRSFYGYAYGMLGNDQYGDCVEAGLYHALMHARKAAGRPDVPAGDDTLAALTLQAYGQITGFSPADPSTDQGTDPAQAYTYWQQTGIPLPDGTVDRIAGSVQVLPHDGVNVRRSIYEFDCAGLALAMPIAWQQASTWDLGGDPLSDPSWQPGGWGGHWVIAVSYDRDRLAVVTWGGIKLLTWRALGTYGQLVLAAVSQDQIGPGGVSQTGVDYARLAQDLALL